MWTLPLGQLSRVLHLVFSQASLVPQFLLVFANPAPDHMHLKTPWTAWYSLSAKFPHSSSSVLALFSPSHCEEWGALSDTATTPTNGHHIHTPEVKAGDTMPSNKRLTSIKWLGRKKSTFSTLEDCSKLALVF